MADAMLKNSATGKKDGRATDAVTSQPSQHPQQKENVPVKGKGKAPAPREASTLPRTLPSTSTGGQTPAGPGATLQTFNAEAISILREMHNNQNKTNEKVEMLATKVDELYNWGNEHYDEYEYEGSQNYEIDVDDDQLSGIASSIEVINPIEQTDAAKRPAEESDVFSRYLKKFKKTDEVDKDINPMLADVVNNAFREGMSDDTYNELIKLIHRPGNCVTLKETRENQGVWSVLKSTTQTEDSKLRGIQNAIVKATINVAKILDAGAMTFDSTILDLGADAIGILGQANRWLNIRRRDLHKKDMDPKLHYLCSSSVEFTDQLYGDSIVKDIKDAQEINKISRQVGTQGRGQRGQGRGYGYNRGRGGRANFYKRRPSFNPSATLFKGQTQTNVAKNSKGEHSSQKK